MISIGKISSVEQAVRYLREAVADQRIEYYTARGESPGRWHGQGAEALSLAGEVTDADFAAVLAGKHPRTGQDLGRHWGTQRVVAFDVAMSAPKDVSILYALSDERTRATILRIHSEGVHVAAAYLQDNAGWARQYNRETATTEPVRARMVMPTFVHRTARPVTDPATGEVTVDPQLHTHVTIPAWAQRPDGSWSQLWGEPLYQHAATAGAIAQAEWRDRLVRELGVSTVVDGTGCFSIVGITEVQRREFSRRTLQIEAAERALDIDSFRGHKVAVVDTRESKDEVAPTADLFAEWRERAETVGLDDARLAALRHREPAAHLPRRLDVTTPDAVLGVRGLTAQSATFSRRDLLRTLASHAPLGMSRSQLETTADTLLADRDRVGALTPPAQAGESALDATRRWVESGREMRYTTPEMLGLEQRMLDTARRRQAAGVGIAAAEHVTAAVAARPTLTAGQRAMVETVCTTPAGVVVVEGAAGVGKTYALQACREAFDASGVSSVGCALAGRAAAELQSGSEIPSATITSLLRDLEIDHLPTGGVLVVDEAGMIGDRQLAELVEAAARDNAKLVLVGDPQQLQPIDGGAPMRVLGERLGRILVTENVRQVATWERAALALMRDADANAAYHEYARRQRVHVADSAQSRCASVVEDHRSLAAEGVDAVMLARRRDEVDALNRLARQVAVADGRVGGPALHVGDRDFQVGDRLVCLANDRRGDLTNGTRGTVAGVDVDRALLTVQRADGGAVVIDTTRYDAIDHGYALTVHKAQGMTADVALVVGSDGATRQWAYTALSRGTLATHYYEVGRPAERDVEGVRHGWQTTPSAEHRIVRSWSRSEEKDSALDYPARYEAAREPAASPALDLSNSPTEGQRELLEHLGAPELGPEATWVDASLALDRHLGHEPGSRLWYWLHETGYSDAAADAVLRGGDPDRALALQPADPRSPVGRTVDGIETLAADPLLQAANDELDLTPAPMPVVVR